ncbi:hypothetical protein N7G274_004338 [Stereocaulon virgatum]|uniref:C2H2-type domain-containing protein n=1 Tax=Stereocaulon virgatum TaxID=373712 RepID=A0ABR4AAS8_9LECA
MEAPSPPRSLQGGESPLVSAISTGRQQPLPSHSRNHHEIVVHNPPRSRLDSTSVHRQDVSTFATFHQQEAIGILRHFDDRSILDWLTLLRSLQPGYQHCAHPGGLPREHFNAVAFLKDCPNGLILAWLDIARCNGKQASSRSSQRSSGISLATTANSSKLTRSLDSTSRTSTTSLGPHLSYNNDRTSHSTLSSSSTRGPGLSFLSLSREPSISETASHTSTSGSHTYWCTVCEHRRAFRTCDGWKRHMKEHEASYICMPYGPMESTDIGSKCGFCDTPDPSEDHLASHSYTLCEGKLLTARSYSRKSQLTKHLGIHGSPDPSALADRWRCTLLNKRFFSCGFCVNIFTKHSELLHHLDIVHFRHSQDIAEWDCNKVIMGLLLSPKIWMHWKKISSCHCLTDGARFTWNPSVARDLQMRLEVCEEAAEGLARTAFNECVCEWSQGFTEDIGAVSNPTEQYMNNNPNILEYQGQAATSRISSSDPECPSTVVSGLPNSRLAYGQTPVMPWTALDRGNRLGSSPATTGMRHDQAQSSHLDHAMDLSQDHRYAQFPSHVPGTSTHFHCDNGNIPRDLHLRNMPTQLDSSAFESWQASNTGIGRSHQPDPSTTQPRRQDPQGEQSHGIGSTLVLATSHNGSAHTQSMDASAPKRGKSPSIIAQLKRNSSRGRLREPAPESPEPTDMDIDLDFG